MDLRRDTLTGILSESGLIGSCGVYANLRGRLRFSLGVVPYSEPALGVGNYIGA